MAFSFANVAGSGGFGGQAQASGGAQVQDGGELQEIQTDQIGFSSISGEAKVRILASPWPVEALPPPTSSLLSVASSKGYIAAAGPDALIFASTESVRNAFRSESNSDNNIRSLQAPVQIPVPRLAHVAFSVDESVLVVSPNDQGGLAVYQVDTLVNGNTNPAMQISTNNTGLRALIPNPAADSAELFAAITSNGELLIADLKAGNLKNGPNGPILQTGTSCLSWSNRGKQLVVGQANGTATQMKPDGTVVAEIPKSTSIPADYHVSAISWLENDLFLVIYTPNNTTNDGMMPSSEYYIITRQPKSSNFTFQKLPEVCPPFGLERLPSFHFINRLRNFSPHLQDLLVVAATNSIDVSLLSKTDSPLSKEEPVTGIFTLTTINDDTRRAQLPLSESMSDTSAIGVAIDLSSKENVVNPIPSDPEIPQSATPLPNLMILNHEGILVSWWIVYNDSIRERTAYSGLVAASSPQGDQMQAASTPVQTFRAQSSTDSTTPNTFSQSGFTSTTPFAKPTTSLFGALESSSTLGNGSSNVFGAAPSTIGSGKSAWTSTGFGTAATQSSESGFGQPAFGAATPVGATPATTFGAASTLGSRPSPFGQPAIPSAPSFGQTGFGAKAGGAFGGGSTQSPFAAAAGDRSAPSGFSSFSQSNGFSGFGVKKETESIFANPTGSARTPQDTSNIFGAKGGSKSFFEDAKPVSSGGLFERGFKLESSFKGDGSAKDDLPKPLNSGGFGFGGQTFDSMLGEPKEELSPTHDTEAEMDEKEDGERSESSEGVENDRTGVARGHSSDEPSRSMITPPSTVVHHKATPAPPLSNLFGSVSKTPTTTTPLAVQNASSGWSFGGLPSTTPKDTPAPSHISMFGTSTESGTTPAAVQKSEPTKLFSTSPFPPSKPLGSPKRSASPLKNLHEPPKIKAEPPSDDESVDLRNVPEAPLPPDPTSRDTYSPGNTSASSNKTQVPANDAPLPPDFVSPNKLAAEDHQPGPPEDGGDFSSDFEGSGEDVEEDVSPIEDDTAEQTEQLLTSPESSFGRGGDKSIEESPTGGLFTKVTSTQANKAVPRPLFGEVGAGPIFAPPKPQESPRSPSPIRNSSHADLLRPEVPRSFSAPSRPPVLDRRKAELAQSAMAQQATREKERSAARDREQADALARAKLQAEAEAAQELEDDEDERLRAELEAPLEPSSDLDAFLPHHPVHPEDSSKAGIPGQTERLYQDINSMVITLGINARSLSGFMLFQQSDGKPSWPDILKSDSPMEATDDEWRLGEIPYLRDGEDVLGQLLDCNKICDVASKLQQCQTLLSDDLHDLRTKLSAVRKTFSVRSDANLTTSAPLSAEQAFIQHDLRKSSTSVQTKIAQAEESLTILRAKLAEVAPAHEKGGKGFLGRSNSQKKPTVEAVTNTIAKMTSMAEKKSADIDVLEAQMKRLQFALGESTNGSLQGSVELKGTPLRGKGRLTQSPFGRSSGSTAGSVYHTPDSRFSGSVRSTPGTGRKAAKANGNAGALISVEDRERWITTAQRKKEVAGMVRAALAHKRGKGVSSGQK